MDLYVSKCLNNCLRLLFLMLLAQPGWAEIPDSLTKITPQVRITRQINDSDLATLSGSRLAILDGAADQGPVNNNLILPALILHLKPSARQQAALSTFNAAQLAPGNADYHHWLTPDEYAGRFGAAPEDIKTLSNYLTAKGFKIIETSKSGLAIVFSGTAGQLKNAFHTEIHRILWKGEQHIANINDPQIPSAFADVVAGLVNLHDFHSHSRRASLQFKKQVSAGNVLSAAYPRPADLFTAGNIDLGGSNYLTPGDYAAIYDINPLYNASINGAGYSIAVLGRSDVLGSDITAFQNYVGQPAKLPQTIVTNTDPGYVSGDQLESSLDLEWATGVASGAAIKFITSATTGSTDGILLSANYAVQQNIGDVITLSYGQCEPQMGFYLTYYFGSLWNQAQTQGQTVLISSGDSGAAGCDAPNSATAVYGASVNGICSSPYSTCVGGTQFLDTANPSQYWLSGNPSGSTVTATGYIPEGVWNDSGVIGGGADLYASGGGRSLLWAKPSWQSASGVPADGVRDVPDVAMTTALHDGYIMFMNGAEYIAGGTSAAAPSLAGVMSMLVQYQGGRQGNINANLYGLYQLQAAGSYHYFHPTLSGNNSVPGQAGFSATGGGYNLATGLGSVDANLLVRHWNDLSNIGNPQIHAAVASAVEPLIPFNTTVGLSASAASISSGQAVTFTAAVQGDAPTGNVQFVSGASVLGTAPVSNGSAQIVTSALTADGNNAVTANYLGDANNLPASSANLTELVLANTAIAVSSSAGMVTAGQSLTLTANVSGNSPTGTVQFYLNGQALGAPVAVSNGVAVLTTSIAVTGQDTITASYSGDNSNAAASSAGITETVAAAQPTQTPALSAGQELLLAAALLALMLALSPRSLKRRQTEF
ncbi:MAG: Ig-like domain repeat protein [Methylomonas sp.]